MCVVCCAQELVLNLLSSQAQNLRTAAETHSLRAALEDKQPELQQLKAENWRLAQAQDRARKEAAVRATASMHLTLHRTGRVTCHWL